MCVHYNSFSDPPLLPQVESSLGLRFLDLLHWENSELYGLFYVTLMQAVLAYLQGCFIHVQVMDRTSEAGMNACQVTVVSPCNIVQKRAISWIFASIVDYYLSKTGYFRKVTV